MEAEAGYLESLDIFRELATSNPSAYQYDVAVLLNNLGNFYRDTRRLKEAETNYQESLEILRPLAESSPTAYQAILAHALNDLAIF